MTLIHTIKNKLNRPHPASGRIPELLLQGHSRSEIFKILVSEFKEVKPLKIAKMISVFPDPNDYKENIKSNRTYLVSILSICLLGILFDFIRTILIQRYDMAITYAFAFLFLPNISKDMKQCGIIDMYFASYSWFVLCICFVIASFDKTLEDKNLYVALFLFIALIFSFLSVLGLFFIKRTFKKFTLKRMNWDEVKKEPIFTQ